MKPIYKKINILMPHCPKCKEQLGGNNSMVLPWECTCGMWIADTYPFLGEWEIQPRLNFEQNETKRTYQRNQRLFKSPRRQKAR